MNRSNVMAEGLKEYLNVIDERIEEINQQHKNYKKNQVTKAVKETHPDTVLEEVSEEVTKVDR